MNKPLAQRIREIADTYPNQSNIAADLYLAADVLGELFNSGQRMSTMPLFINENTSQNSFLYDNLFSNNNIEL